MKKLNLARFTSRKFLLAVVAAVVAFGNAYFDWGITEEQVWTIISPLIGFILIEGVGDAMEKKSI